MGRASRRAQRLAQVQILEWLCTTPIKAKKRNRRPKRQRDVWDKDPRELQWWKQINDRRVQDPESREGKLFRRRFRVPFSVFQWIVTLWRAKKWPGCSKYKYNFGGPLTDPLELKIMAALRYLGRGECWDTCSEFSGIPEGTLRKFGYSFFRWTFLIR